MDALASEDSPSGILFSANKKYVISSCSLHSHIYLFSLILSFQLDRLSFCFLSFTLYLD